MTDILIVDDEPSARRTLRALLLNENHSLHFAASGAEALEMTETLAPDLMLLDVMMPGMDGFEVCTRFKANTSLQHVPVILITALDSKEDVARGLDSGADEFLSKPVNGLELRARVRSMLRLKLQYDKLQTALKFRNDLSHMLVHDLRSPLNVIRGFSELTIMRDNLSPQAVSNLERIQTEADRMSSFIDDLLTMTKMEESYLQLNYTTIDPTVFILDVQKNYAAAARAKAISVEAELPQEPGATVTVDVTLLQRVLDNLVSNALKFSPAQSKITLKVSYPPSTGSSPASDFNLQLQVIDQGPGIAPEYRQRIFDKFEVVKSGRNPIAQFGLGLAFCKMVVEAHGGKIFVSPNTPTGTIFTVQV